jgi:septal ring factor EnvC (AmiA/AmiB activator)
MTKRPLKPGLWVLAATAGFGVGLADRSPAQEQEDPVQRQIRESQERLDAIRGERQQLRQQLESLSGQVHNVSEEIRNIERQLSTSSSVVAELGVQINALVEQILITTRDMLFTHDQLTARKVILQRRLREIYKRGPLAPVQALLAANSFGDLLNRYKYLHQVAMFDRMLVLEIQRLESQLVGQRDLLAGEATQVQNLRQEKGREIDDLRRLEQQRQRRLRTYSTRQTQAESRLAQLALDEQRLRNLLTELERARRDAERLSGTATTSTLRTSDLGQLNWPVEGGIVYGFGPERVGQTTTLREGIGIAAPAGTPVRAVESGTVMYAGPRNLYGQSVILGHGGGYYSVYLYMQRLAVREGAEVDSGQVIGSVGGAASPEGPHVEFQIYEPSAGGTPRAVDPVRWLRGRG